jgi:GAF domain-containing protein
MVDHDLLADEVDRFTSLVVQDYAVTDALHDLVDAIGPILGVHGAGVSLLHGDRLTFATAAPETIAAVERAQEQAGAGPCADAVATGEPVFVRDLAAEPERWPSITGVAAAAGIRAVAGIPMRLDDVALGALDLYDTDPHDWDDDEARAARRLAALATGYVVNASRVDRLRHTSEQLREALESRVIIEQAKGILAGERQISVDQAFEMLRAHARRNQASLRAVAEAVVTLRLRPD